METTSGVSTVQTMYTMPDRTLMPGLITGVIFLLLTAASLPTTGNVALVRQVASDRNAEAGSLSAVVGTLRLHRGPEPAAQKLFPLESATNVLSRAHEILEQPDLLTATDRVTLEISLHDLRSDRAGLRGTGQQMAQVRSRRMEALELRATICVRSAEDLGHAADLAELMLTEGALSVDRLGISIDARMNADALRIELLRSIRPVRMPELLP